MIGREGREVDDRGIVHQHGRVGPISDALTVSPSPRADLIAHDRTLWHPDRLQPRPFDNDKYFGLVPEAEAARRVP
jgi:hypothetical protein